MQLELDRVKLDFFFICSFQLGIKETNQTKPKLDRVWTAQA